MTPLLGFSPDLEPTTPGVITDCSNLIPYESGMKAAPAPVGVGLDDLADICQGASVTRDLQGNSRLFAGTETDLYEASGTTWTSVGSGYTLADDDRWKFAIFGNASLAISPGTVLQRSLSGAFAEVTGAPAASAIVSSKGFVLAFNTNEATYGDSPDRWWCSAYLDETDWTPDIATQCTTGRLLGGSGPIVAALRFGDQVVAYKDRAIFVGTYSGSPIVWQWDQVGYDVGCVGVDAVADTPVGHVLVGNDNVYLFDGTRPTPIATGVMRQWWLDNSSSEYRYLTKLLWDRDNNVVWMFYPSTSSSGECDQVLAYHVYSKQWGRITMTVEACLTHTSSGVSYDTGSPLVTTFDTGPDISFDSPFWLASKSSPAVFNTSHTLQSLTGVPQESSFTTGDYGDEEAHFLCTELRARFAAKPGTLTCQGFTLETSGDVTSVGTLSAFDGSKFPLRQSGRFHRFTVRMSGTAKISAIRPKLKRAGSR